MSTTTGPSVQLPDGYVATERIGSGGYGEVWRATAPGGVEKAIKVVFGHCSEDLAERELKSLERIRAVRHPFVISLERFEIVAGRLIIVTELADMSLDACFRRHQEAGEQGVPRAELLGYLGDAADALDCLVERHALQHLDIKPENLLVVGDHVKVGDFGLVKELATRTLNSMMGGMTPLYSAPEVFDDAPSPRSDQYSLAIVYQQMLTGQMPFPGRTPAQLAKQHTQAEPCLNSLSASDQKVVRRALAKKPEQRFASCREFVAALVSGSLAESVRAVVPPTAVPRRLAPDTDDDTKSTSSIQTQPVASAMPSSSPLGPTEHRGWQDQQRPAKAPTPIRHYPSVDEQVVDVALPNLDVRGASSIPTIMVGIGGLGITLLQATRNRIGQSATATLDRNDLAWLAIDTDRDTLNATASDDNACRLAGGDLLHIPLKRPKQYREGSQSLLRWVSRRWLYNIPRSLETRGYRPLGRIAAVDHAESILHGLYARLHQLSEANPSAPHLRVVLLAGTSGGTGSGVVVDLAQAVRSLTKDLAISVQVHGLLAMPERSAGTADSLAIANNYSLITELAHAQRRGNLGHLPPSGPAARYEAEHPAFDTVYLVSIPPRTLGDHRIKTFDSVAEYLAAEATNPEAAAAIDACRALQTGQDFRFRSVGCTQLPEDADFDHIMAHADPGLLGCGYRRVTLLVSRAASTAPAALKQQRPQLAVCEAAVSSDVLITEGFDIDPLNVAARMAEFYPDIADAADRLRTRDDIEWQDLREQDEPLQGDLQPSPPPVEKSDSQQTVQRVSCV